MLYFISQVALMTLTSGNYHYQVRQLPQQVFFTQISSQVKQLPEQVFPSKSQNIFWDSVPQTNLKYMIIFFFISIEPYLKVIKGGSVFYAIIMSTSVRQTRLHCPFQSYVHLFRKSLVSTRQAMERGFQEYLFIL